MLIFTAFDGFLRIYNYSNMKPLACVKADFGAFNCMTLSKDQKLLAAGGQDDSITIVNLNNFSAFKLEIHKSFISQCRFFQPQNIKKLRREHLAKLEKMKKKYNSPKKD